MLVLSNISTAIMMKARGSSLSMCITGAHRLAVNGGKPCGMFLTILIGPLPSVPLIPTTTTMPITQARKGPRALRNIVFGYLVWVGVQGKGSGGPTVW